MENTLTQTATGKKTLWKVILTVLAAFAAYKSVAAGVNHLDMDPMLNLFLRESWMLVCALGAAAFMKRLGTLKFTFKGFGSGLVTGIWYLIVPTFSLAGWLLLGAPVTVSALSVVLFVVSMFLIGLGEELLFRGVLLNGCLDAFGDDSVGSIRKAVVVSGAIFGVVHLFNFLNGAAISSTLIQAINNIGAGMLFGAIYVRSRKNMWPGIMLHMYNDFCTFASAGLLSGNTTNEALSRFHVISLVQFVVLILVALFVLRSKKLQPLVSDRQTDALPDDFSAAPQAPAMSACQPVGAAA